MYPAPWSDLPDFRAHDWVTSPGLTSIRHVAEAMVDAAGIADGDTLVGCSLGGMVAGEITKLRKIPQLFLVGSAVKKEEVNAWAARLHPLAGKVPISWLKKAAGKLPHEAAIMLAEADPGFIRRMCPAIFQWEGLGESDTRVWRIHGRKDLLIAPPEKCDLLLGGGHLIAMTHAKECVDFVRQRLA